MESLGDTTLAALYLLVSGNRELWEIIAISFRVSGIAILVATPPALLAAFLLTYKRFPGQIALAFPILVAMGHSALQASDIRAWETARTLGATPIRALITIMREARFGLMAALLAAFGRIIAEVGASMMLGGNILHYTRNIPTAIALESSKGEFAQGIALGLVLLTLAFSLNALLQHIQDKGHPVT
ncbi:MAG: ABC transporter permease [Candidatus Thiodiazotropha endolucinida]